jgi:hypothetical protein
VKRKLQLEKQTVRRLATADLAQVGGGSPMYYVGGMNPLWVFNPVNPFTGFFSQTGTRCGLPNDSKDGGSGI